MVIGLGESTEFHDQNLPVSRGLHLDDRHIRDADGVGDGGFDCRCDALRRQQLSDFAKSRIVHRAVSAQNSNR
jgi:hypothetical protein